MLKLKGEPSYNSATKHHTIYSIKPNITKPGVLKQKSAPY